MEKYTTTSHCNSSRLTVKRKRSKKHRLSFFRTLTFLAVFCILVAIFLNQKDFFRETAVTLMGETSLKKYATEHGISLSEYPQDLIDLYKRNPETKQFVFEYPLKKDHPPVTDLSGTDTSSVPLFLQWDQRWGYDQYAGDLFGLSGCGPTCLSMVAVYLTGNTDMSPSWMGKYATSHGYAVEGSGSAWALFSEGGRDLGFDVTEIPLDEQRIIDNLKAGNPIIAIMGPGDFTSSGHFIVLSGYENGHLKINDPNSKSNSETLWDFSKIQDQIRNLWVFRNP